MCVCFFIWYFWRNVVALVDVNDLIRIDCQNEKSLTSKVSKSWTSWRDIYLFIRIMLYTISHRIRQLPLIFLTWLIPYHFLVKMVVLFNGIRHKITKPIIIIIPRVIREGLWNPCYYYYAIRALWVCELVCC